MRYRRPTPWYRANTYSLSPASRVAIHSGVRSRQARTSDHAPIAAHPQSDLPASSKRLLPVTRNNGRKFDFLLPTGFDSGASIIDSVAYPKTLKEAQEFVRKYAPRAPTRVPLMRRSRIARLSVVPAGVTRRPRRWVPRRGRW